MKVIDLSYFENKPFFDITDKLRKMVKNGQKFRLNPNPFTESENVSKKTGSGLRFCPKKNF